MEDLAQVPNMTGKVRSILQWNSGDAHNAGSQLFGEAWSQHADDAGYNQHTLDNYAAVCRKFPLHRRRLEGLFFGHHEAVSMLPEERQDYWLDEALKLDADGKIMSVSELRLAVADEKPARKKNTQPSWNGGEGGAFGARGGALADEIPPSGNLSDVGFTSATVVNGNDVSLFNTGHPTSGAPETVEFTQENVGNAVEGSDFASKYAMGTRPDGSKVLVELYGPDHFVNPDVGIPEGESAAFESGMLDAEEEHNLSQAIDMFYDEELIELYKAEHVAAVNLAASIEGANTIIRMESQSRKEALATWKAAVQAIQDYLGKAVENGTDADDNG